MFDRLEILRLLSLSRHRSVESLAEHNVLQPSPPTVLAKDWLRFRNHLDYLGQVIWRLARIVWNQLIEELKRIMWKPRG